MVFRAKTRQQIESSCFLTCHRDAKNMARDVHNVLRGIIMKHASLDEKAAEDYIQNLHAKGRFEQDVWS
jgi:hypothetical protein